MKKLKRDKTHITRATARAIGMNLLPDGARPEILEHLRGCRACRFWVNSYRAIPRYLVNVTE